MSEPEYEKLIDSNYGRNNFDVHRQGRSLLITLTYPNVTAEGVTHVELDQESVRATDGIRLHFDYNRNGWVIEQPTILEWSVDEENFERGWKEVAYIEAWALKAEQDANENKLQ